MDYFIYDNLWRLSQSGMDKAKTLTFDVYEQPISDYVLPETGWDFRAGFSTTQSGAILDSLFVFEMQKGATYDIFIHSYFDPYLLYLYDNLGNVIAYDNDFISNYVAPYSGLYYAEAGWHQGLASNHKYVSISVYEDIDTIPLELSGSTDDYPGDVNTTGSLALGSTVISEIGVLDDEDWFEIQLDAGTTYLLSAQSTELDDLKLQLLDKYGSQIEVDTSLGEYPALFGFTPIISDTYYVAVGDYISPSTGIYSISLELSGTTDDYLGDVNTTGSLALGSTGSGEIEVPNDEDWFEIQLDAGTTYHLSAQSTELYKPYFRDTHLRLLDDNGSVIRYSKSPPYDSTAGETPAFIEFTPTVSGTYYMSVEFRLGIIKSIMSAEDMYISRTGSYSINLDAIDSFPALPDNDIDRIFNWGESVYTNLFPEHRDSQNISGYYARIYSNGDALGEQDGNIYYYDGGADGTGNIILVGRVSDYLPQAEAAGF